jgi:hypothetical protein
VLSEFIPEVTKMHFKDFSPLKAFDFSGSIPNKKTAYVILLTVSITVDSEMKSFIKLKLKAKSVRSTLSRDSMWTFHSCH